jgi:hypothetical protein
MLQGQLFPFLHGRENNVLGGRAGPFLAAASGSSGWRCRIQTRRPKSRGTRHFWAAMRNFCVRGWVYNNQAIFLRAPCHPGITKLSFNFFSFIYDADSVLADSTDLGETGKRRRMLKKPMRIKSTTDLVSHTWRGSSHIDSTTKSPVIYTTCAKQQWPWIPKENTLPNLSESWIMTLIKSERVDGQIW